MQTSASPIKTNAIAIAARSHGFTDDVVFISGNISPPPVAARPSHTAPAEASRTYVGRALARSDRSLRCYLFLAVSSPSNRATRTPE
jgi:hypothetical protein